MENADAGFKRLCNTPTPHQCQPIQHIAQCPGCSILQQQFTSVYGEPLSFLQLTYSLTSPPPAAGQNSKLNPRLGNVRRSAVQGFSKNAKVFEADVI